MRKNNLKISSSQVNLDNEKSKSRKYHYYTDTNIDSYVDIAMSQELHKKLDKINEQIEDVGKLCDNKKKKSYEEYKEVLNYERQELNKGIKDLINQLKLKLKEYHEKVNFNYKGKFKEENIKLNNMIKSLDKNISYYNQIQNKFDEFEEDNNFFEKQLENVRDMNYYLKYKLKILTEKDKKENEEKNINSSMLNNISSDYSNISLNKNNEEKNLLITTTGNSYKKTKEYLNIKEQIEKDLKFKMNFIIERIKKDISNTKKENDKLINYYREINYKNNNIYMKNLKEIINDVKSNFNTEDSKELPEIYQNNYSNYYSGNNSSTNYLSKSLSNYGFMDKLNKKEIMLKYLENEQVKKFIYKYIYEV